VVYTTQHGREVYTLGGVYPGYERRIPWCIPGVWEEDTLVYMPVYPRWVYTRVYICPVYHPGYTILYHTAVIIPAGRLHAARRGGPGLNLGE